MKNRLSTLLMVLLTAFMVQCSGCKDDKAAEPSIEGAWKIDAVTSSQGAAGVTAKYNAVGGTFEITSSTYAIKATSGPTPGGSGAAALVGPASGTGSVTLDPAAATKVTLSYSDLTATSVTLSGNVTNGTGKTTTNDVTFKLSR